MTDWLVLSATLPTSPSGLRVRVWRALKATGAGTLREGVYVLPAGVPAAQALRDIEATILGAGAQAHLLELKARDAAQERAFRALFDRSELYAGLVLQAREMRKAGTAASEAQLQKDLRALERQLQQIQASDFFPGKDSTRAAEALARLRREIDLRRSPDEPQAVVAPVPRLDPADFQGRTWATRRRPWVDRLATAWLVLRFIDRRPAFLWLADARKCPKDAVGYDFDGATFSHVGERVTFEVVAQSFGLDAQPGIRRLGELVREIDVGGAPSDETPGIELLVRGLQAKHADDDNLLQAAAGLFDALLAALSAQPAR